jgi:hypothetical protein
VLLAGQAFAGRGSMLPLYVAEGCATAPGCSRCARSRAATLREHRLIARAAPIVALLALPALWLLEARGVEVLPPELLLSRMGLTTSLLG